MKKFSMWLVILSMLAAIAPENIAFAEKTWINIEAEDGVYSEDFSEYTHDSASGGKGLVVGKTIQEEKTPGIDWTFDVPESGKYDAWMLVLKPNKQYLSRFKIAFNDAAPEYFLNTATSVHPYADSSESDLRFPVYKLNHGLGFEDYLGWVKIAENKDFSQGENKLHYEIEARKLPNDRIFLNSIDCIRIVPSEWNWMAKPDLSEPSPNTDPDPDPEIPVFEADENGLVWMEAEKAYAPDYDIQNIGEGRGEASGGKYISIGKHLNNSDGTPNLDERFSAQFKFNIKEKDSYDIWMLAQEPNKSHLSRYMTSVDGEEPHYITSTYGGYLIENAPSIFQGYVAGGWFNNHWVRVETGKILEEGIHSFDYVIGARPLNDGYYITTLDCVAAVPSSWNWNPYGTADKAKPPIGDYAWIELENSQETSHFSKVVRGTTGGSESMSWTDVVSNKSALTADGIAVDGNEKLSYKFNIKNDGNYDIYYLGSNCATTYLSRLWWGIDNSDIFTDAKNPANQLAASGEDISPEMFKIGDHGLFWQKMAVNKTLTAGEHTLYLEYVNRQIAADHYMRADCVIVVPSEWNWKMPAAAEEPGKTAVELDVLEQFYALKNAYSDGVSGNIENLDVRGSAGSKFKYIAKAPDIITEDGIVTHPGIGEGMIRGALAFTANKELNAVADTNPKEYAYKYVSSETVAMFTILELGSVEYNGFEAKYQDGAPIGSELISGAEINAGVSIKTNDAAAASGAMIAVAVYKDGALVRVSGNEIALGSDYQTLSASVTLPEDSDMSGYSVKVFLWDGMATANPYQEALEY